MPPRFEVTICVEAWGIGKRGQDNGVLFLWSSGDRRVRIEVGYGLESVITDGRSGSILDRYVTPEFKAGAYDRGVLQGVEAIAALIRRQPVELPSPATTLYEEPQSSASRALRVVPWALGGAFSAVGALFGFGRWRRRRPRRCPNCRAAMKRLREAEDDEYLEAVKQLEERIGSVDYDVWKCAACAGRMVLRYPRWFSRYRPCPQCGNRTCSSNAVTQVAATTSGSGLEEVTEVCAFCNFRHVFTRTIPRISASSSSSGSLSSSGSSSSSFGGGSSGGGGSSRGY